MNILRALLLGVLQGATEFLPVSSSGHLVLVPWLLGWGSPGLAFDAVVHWGTAVAVIIYFWHDWLALIVAGLRSLQTLISRGPRPPRARGPEMTNNPSEGSGAEATWIRQAHHRLFWLIVLGTVPGVLAGYLLEDFFEGMFARPATAAAFLLVTAALLTASERLGRREHDLERLSWPDALIIGVGQALAILPGISRSGATIAAGLSRGLRREPSARFSFLLATPIILGAGLLKVVELAQMGGLTAQAPVLIGGFVAAAAVGLACIHFLLRYLERRRLYPFAAYCAIFGVTCLIVALVRGI